MTISPSQVKEARELLGWSRERLAGETRVATSTVGKFETDTRQPSLQRLAAIQRTLEAAGVEFTNGGEPGVKLAKDSGQKMITTRQIKAARALLAWTYRDLARHCDVPYPTVVRLETVDGRLRGRAATVTKVVTTLEAAGVIFVDENGEGLGVRLRKGASDAKARDNRNR